MDDPEKTQDLVEYFENQQREREATAKQTTEAEKLSEQPEQPPEQPPEIKRPICPKCGADPLEVATCPLQIGRLTFWCLMCTVCRCPIPVSVVDVAQPQIHQPKGRIAIA
jgi:RNase P subunit RPR2